MSVLVQQISAVEAQLQDAWSRKDGAEAKRLKAELERLWEVRRRCLAQTTRPSWGHCDRAVFRRTR